VLHTKISTFAKKQTHLSRSYYGEITAMNINRPSLLAVVLLLAACDTRPPLDTVDAVDLQRFMGDWYVIASIPTFFEREAYNPIETYSLNADGSIATTFTFNAGSTEGEPKIFRATGFVQNIASNAQWGMQFVWPIKADYRIVYLDEDYQYTVIARQKRDYVWIMARSPQVTAEKFAQLQTLVTDIGYDTQLLQRAYHRAP
jgi:apolipoprotein D and lipocalin family protein